uniref:Ribosomal protein L32 n=1 Tax=Jakoba bahamiensis TaxID=221721 RepID=M4QC11_9EUKA|nr:ribosomal protein L32 [Jakoba bahamiensis]AGH24119.1 ribosomal protein L32 [Jakoba bahamiensis]
MAVPKKKISYSKKRIKLQKTMEKPITYSVCNQCGSLKYMHHLCTNCGYYEKYTAQKNESR